MVLYVHILSCLIGLLASLNLVLNLPCKPILTWMQLSMFECTNVDEKLCSASTASYLTAKD